MVQAVVWSIVLRIRLRSRILRKHDSEIEEICCANDRFLSKMTPRLQTESTGESMTLLGGWVVGLLDINIIDCYNWTLIGAPRVEMEVQYQWSIQYYRVHIENIRCLMSWILRHEFCITAHGNETVVFVSRIVSGCCSSWGDCVKSVALRVKKSPSVWSRHSYSVTRLLQRCTHTLSWLLSWPSDRCSVHTTPLFVSSLTPSQEIASLQFSCSYIGCLYNLGLSTNCASRNTLITWPRWFNLLQRAHRGPTTGLSSLPVISCTGSQRW